MCLSCSVAIKQCLDVFVSVSGAKHVEVGIEREETVLSVVAILREWRKSTLSALA